MSASAYIQEVPAPSSGQIYKNVSDIIGYTSSALSNIIFDRITKNINLQDSFAITAFFKEAEIANGSEEFHVFQSEHYRDIIFRRAERMLRKEGYECAIRLDDSGRLRKISYSAQVVHPLRKAMRMVMPFIPLAIGYASYSVYAYVNSDHQRRSA